MASANKEVVVLLQLIGRDLSTDSVSDEGLLSLKPYQTSPMYS